MKSVELFVGAGGLAIGLSRAGFHHGAVVEWDHDACQTIRANQCRRGDSVVDWPLIESDVRDVDFTRFRGQIQLLAGGPPCQPFSLGGRHKAYLDSRDMFPEVFRAVRETQPQAVLIENVRGLVRPTFAKYFEYILLQLTYPTITARQLETWADHLTRLERHHTKGECTDLRYNVLFRVLNAADYGVPQRRERVFIVGIRADLGRDWSFPRATHSFDALLFDQWITGAYWERHSVPPSRRPTVPDRVRMRAERLASSLFRPLEQPWSTVRDAIHDLPDPESGQFANLHNHRFNAGARPYVGHTGSLLDEPAKTLKAGDHGVPGGENMLVKPNGEVRYFTVREAARLQTFPDDFEFLGAWSETMRQLGNAVPVQLAALLGKDLRRVLDEDNVA